MASGSSLSSVLHLGKRNQEDDQVNQLLNIQQPIHMVPPAQADHAVPPKKRRNPPGISYPDAEVIALSPNSLMATNRFVCEVCHKGFPREQNLQLHKRGHNLPWKLKQRATKDEGKKKLYLCPEPSCINHNPSHALGDLTGVKKHYSRKHGEKKYKCQKCSKLYAVESDLKAHSKNCGRKEYQCHCGTLFARRDSFMAHRAFCEALAKGTVIRHPATLRALGVGPSKRTGNSNQQSQMSVSLPQMGSQVPSIQNLTSSRPAISPGASLLGQTSHNNLMIKPSMDLNCYKPSPAFFSPSSDQQNQQKYQKKFDTRIFTNVVNTTTPHNYMELYRSGEGSSLRGGGIVSDHSASLYFSPHGGDMPELSATGLLQKAALLGSTSSNNSVTNFVRGYASSSSSGAVGGTKPERGGLLFGRGHFGISDSNVHDNNMNELLMNSFINSGAASSVFNRYATTYEQEDSYHSGIDSGTRGYAGEWKTFNSEEQQQPQNNCSNMGFLRSSGVTLTRDFLGVGGEMVGNVSSDGPQRTFGGRFL